MGKPTMQEIKSDFLDQLDRNGTTGRYYVDLIEDYMSLWKIKNMLIEDIEERGVQTVYKNGEDQYGTTENKSTAQLLKVSQQMIKIIDALGIKPSQGGESNEDTEM